MPPVLFLQEFNMLLLKKYEIRTEIHKNLTLYVDNQNFGAMLHRGLKLI